MALLDIPKGVLLYVILGNTYRVSDYFPEYHVVRTAEQHEILDKIEREATELQTGIDASDPNLAPHVADNLTYFGQMGNCFCETCPYRKPCSGYQEFFGPQDRKPREPSELIAGTFERLKRELTSVKKTTT